MVFENANIMQNIKIILLLSMVFLTACDSNPLQTIGTVSGATAGGIIGAQVGGDGIGATIGGAIGAVAGKVAGASAGAMGDAAIRNARSNNRDDDDNDEYFYEDDDFDWDTGTLKHDNHHSDKPLFDQDVAVRDNPTAHIDDHDLFVNRNGQTCYYISANNYAQANNNITKKSACLNDDGKWFLDNDG